MSTPSADASADALIAVLAQKNEAVRKRDMYQPIKLTPKGKRWGDVIRKELADPDSLISKAVRELKAWHRLSKTNDRIQLELTCLGNIQVACYGYCVHDADRTDICPLNDVSYLFR